VGRGACRIFLLGPLVILFLLRGAAHADIVTGNVELYDQIGTNKTTDATGLTSEARTRSFLQRYTINYNNLIFPTINLWGRMRVEKQVTNNETDFSTSKTTDTQLAPAGGLAYITPFVVAGVSFDELEEKVDSGSGAFTTIRETKSAFLGFKPEGLPTLDMQYTGQRRYDKEHIQLDTEDTLYTLRSLYQPVRSVQLYYNAAYDDTQFHITQGETKTVTQSGKVSYNDNFFNHRLVLGADYNISQQGIQASRSVSGGAVQVQLFPVNGLSSVNDTPVLSVLDVNQSLIDGNFMVSSGINIGQLPSVTGDTKQRQVGVDFGIPTEVSTLFIWVDRTLPSAISNSFIWDIYTSQDNQNWSLYQRVFPATFGLFDNRFEVSFPPVQTRYIKAVTRPLSVAAVAPPGVDVSNIFITEFQALNTQPLSSAAGSVTTTSLASESANFSGKMDIIRGERHLLQYSLYYQEQQNKQSDQPVQRQSTLTNALIGTDRFSNVFTGSAKIIAQNTNYPIVGASTYYDYEATLAAQTASLKKLYHNLSLTARREEWGPTLTQPRTTRDSGTFSLVNSGEVYPGINAYFSGVENLVSTTTDSIVSRGDNAIISIGADIVPNRALTISLNADWSEGHQGFNPVLGNVSGPPSLSTSTVRRKSEGANVAYNPFSSLYLFGSYLQVEETNKPTITYSNYSVSWSAQQGGGALEIRLYYTENFEVDTQTRTRSYGPYAKWKINARTFVDAAYLISTTDAPDQKIVAHTFNSSFKLYF
jgi:hypothetical protein